MEHKRKMIAFGAHNDDIELRAGGTVAKYAALGYEAIYVVAIDSVCVSRACHKRNPGLSHSRILEMREEESAAGAAILGASRPSMLKLKPSYHWNGGSLERVHFNAGDEALYKGMESHRGQYFCLQAASDGRCVAEVASFIRETEAEIVLTQQPNDLHPEHYAVSALVFTACKRLAKEGVELRLYAWESGSSGRMVRFVPDAIVDISDFMERKTKALEQFHSQVEDSGVFVRYALASGRYWGSKIGVEYAEPFCAMPLDSAAGFNVEMQNFENSSLLIGNAHRFL